MFDLVQKLTGYVQSFVIWVWDQRYELMKDHLWAMATAVFVIARMFGTVVETGWVGVLFSFGKVKAELQPGFHWLVPIVHHVRKVRVRSVSLDLPPQRIVTRDDLVYDVDANVVYHIADSKAAVVQIDDVHAGCNTLISLVIAAFMRERESRQLIDRSRLDDELRALVQTRAERWGVVVEHVGLRSIAPTRETLRITQLQLRCEVRSRMYSAIRAQGLSNGNALALLGSPTQLLEKSVVRYRGHHRRLESRRNYVSLVLSKLPAFKVGDHVWANWWELGDYYPGVVVAIAGEHLRVKFDDGDEETVHLRNIRGEKPLR